MIGQCNKKFIWHLTPKVLCYYVLNTVDVEQLSNNCIMIVICNKDNYDLRVKFDTAIIFDTQLSADMVAIECLHHLIYQVCVSQGCVYA